MSHALANLGMYDGGDLTAANDELWTVIAEHLAARGIADVPACLTRGPLEDIWNERLLFGQTCGYPFISRLAGTLHVVGTPVYDWPGCEGATHRSFIVVATASSFRRLEDLAGSHAVINDPESNSGRNLFGDALASVGARAPFFGQVTVSGSHAQSLRDVAEHSADVAAIDNVSYAHILRAHPSLKEATRILHETRPSPALPFVTASQHRASVVFEAVREALRDVRTRGACRVLRLVGIEPLEREAYEITREFSARADKVFGPRA
ncbi:PhnD/SsuA/transferrin family substrate-binding protein [Pendulispora brunnea]|uniref:PhnD/SsuA/transferrin family substrate-binding protein n=1 Tax=Pendulispora brunnea TaxID=2905690 RepID=A0ABZ2KEX0_9BACT